MGIGQWIAERRNKKVHYDPVKVSQAYKVTGYLPKNINSKVILSVATKSGKQVVANLYFEENCRQVQKARKEKGKLPSAFDGQINGCTGPEGPHVTIDQRTLDEVTAVLNSQYPLQSSWAHKVRSYHSPIGFDPQLTYQLLR